MEIVPAIDISDGKCVRLFKGQKGTEKIYYEDPLDALDFWINQGAQRIHFVDLDGAWGSDKNKLLLKTLVEKAKTKMKVQIGGGIRSFEAAVELIKLGADRIIIGTLAISQPNIITKLAQEIGSQHLMIAIDYKEGTISTHGWTEQSNKDPFIFVQEVEKAGAGFILFSCVEADGAFTGPDFKNIKKMVSLINIPVYAAGGVRHEKDLLKLKSIGVHGVIVGKAFYENKIPFCVVKNSKYID